MATLVHALQEARQALRAADDVRGRRRRQRHDRRSALTWRGRSPASGSSSLPASARRPFAAMMLADHGAEVIRIDRPGAMLDPNDPAVRSRRSVTLDIKTPEGAAQARALCGTADGLIEGFRPGVMERLGLGPGPAARRQSEAGLRADDRLGAGWARWRRPPGTTSITSRCPGCWARSGGPARSRCRRSTMPAISAAAACCSPSAWRRPWSR